METKEKEEKYLIEEVKSQDEIRDLINKTLASVRNRQSILLREKIILTYDAGEEINQSKSENAKKTIIQALHNKGVKKFHSPTRSTIVFEISPGSFADWQPEIEKLFRQLEKICDFYYSIALINSGLNYFDKPDYTLNNSIPDLLKS